MMQRINCRRLKVNCHTLKTMTSKTSMPQLNNICFHQCMNPSHILIRLYIFYNKLSHVSISLDIIASLKNPSLEHF